MDNLERNNLFKCQESSNMIFYKRYVDDVFGIWQGTDIQFNNFLNAINEIHPMIKFTNEIESNCSINYLDLSLTRKYNKIEYKIFRKETHTDTVIPYSSNHPWSHKTAAFRSMIWRALTVPLSNKELLNEVNIIKQIALNNGYKASMVYNIKRSIEKKIMYNSILPENTNKKNHDYKRVAYVGSLNNNIFKVLHNSGVTPAPYVNNTLGKRLFNNKIKSSKNFEFSGVYKLKCGSAQCNATYIGRTGRKISTRVNEHISNIKRVTKLNESINKLETDTKNMKALINNSSSGREKIKHQTKLNNITDIIKKKKKKIQKKKMRK